MALDHKLLGGDIRMIQLSPDSWMLLGYRYDDGASGPCARESPTLLNVDRMSGPHGDAASHNTHHPDDDGDGEDENGEEVPGEHKPHAAGSDQGSRRGYTRFRQRIRKPWLKSDEVRLLA